LQETFCLTNIYDNLVLIIGGYDQKIHVYTTTSHSNQMVFRFSMLGHFNSIKDLSVSP